MLFIVLWICLVNHFFLWAMEETTYNKSLQHAQNLVKQAKVLVIDEEYNREKLKLIKQKASALLTALESDSLHDTKIQQIRNELSTISNVDVSAMQCLVADRLLVEAKRILKKSERFSIESIILLERKRDKSPIAQRLYRALRISADASRLLINIARITREPTDIQKAENAEAIHTEIQKRLSELLTMPCFVDDKQLRQQALRKSSRLEFSKK